MAVPLENPAGEPENSRGAPVPRDGRRAPERHRSPIAELPVAGLVTLDEARKGQVMVAVSVVDETPETPAGVIVRSPITDGGVLPR